MRTLSVRTHGSLSLIILRGKLNDLPHLAETENGIIVADENVNRLHGRRFPPRSLIEIGTGAAVKSLGSGLPVRVPGHRRDELLGASARDKKRERRQLRLASPAGLDRATVANVDLDELSGVLP